MEQHGSNIPVILANGDFPTHRIPLEILKEANYLVCTDGSLNALLRFKKEHVSDLSVAQLEPSAVVGDGDSLSEELKSKYSHIYVEYAEQDYNDLTKATRFCIEKGFREINYLGISGKRDDHAMANFSLLVWYLKNFKIKVRAYTDHGVFIPCCGDNTFEAKKGTQVSIFNFGAKSLKSTNLKWDIYDFDELWQGTLNEVTADSFSIKAEGYYLVFINY
jgi:thiamine pyrophosphokinase